MDPNVTLAALRALMRKLNGDVQCGIEVDPEDVACAFDRWESLDGWLSRGGFLPDEWETGRQ